MQSYRTAKVFMTDSEMRWNNTGLDRGLACFPRAPSYYVSMKLRFVRDSEPKLPAAIAGEFEINGSRLGVLVVV